MIRLDGQMLPNHFLNLIMVKQPLSFEPFRREIIQQEFLQFTPKPAVNRHAEPHLGSLEQCFRHIARQEFPQQILTFPFSVFETVRDGGGKFHHTMIQ